MKIERDLARELTEAAARLPIVTVVGPRQAGKTTLVKAVFPDRTYRTLEDPDVRAFAVEDPRGFLKEVEDGAVLDEIQRVPELMSYLQGMVDADPTPGRFILTGSQHFLMMEKVSQSLAGRTGILTLLPLSVRELARSGVRDPGTDELMQRGFYPRLHERPLDPYPVLRDYFATYVDRDVRQLLKVHDLMAFERFMRLCAGRVGQLLNLSSLAVDAGISATTAREWIGLLETSFVLFRLPPWHANIGKRLIKTPKLYFHDVGLATWLCGIEEAGQLASHPLRGAFFENMAIGELLKSRTNRGRDHRLLFFRDRAGHEVDALLPSGPRLLPVEIKSGRTLRGEWFAGCAGLDALAGDFLPTGVVIYGGDEIQRRSSGTACGLWQLDEVLHETLGA
ncbi:ATP-binding protein [Haloferula sp. A504]|uniref:ATP-binding protein n=1 Tax=Haloferula sp. A504 TaxID=3373601 RepID=UPI0031C9E184|nr:ATP-binding protein [Verrucomicrobiaceae bacterium E54]